MRETTTDDGRRTVRSFLRVRSFARALTRASNRRDARAVMSIVFASGRVVVTRTVRALVSSGRRAASASASGESGRGGVDDDDDDASAETNAETVERLAREMLVEEIEMEERADVDQNASPTRLEARAASLRRAAEELDHQAEVMYSKAHRRMRQRANEMARRASEGRERAREFAARARLLREVARRRRAPGGEEGDDDDPRRVRAPPS